MMQTFRKQVRLISSEKIRKESRAGWSLILLLLLPVAIGCTSEPPHFDLNGIYLKEAEESEGIEITADQKQWVADALYALFGTPDDPDPIEKDKAKSVLTAMGFDVDKLVRAAGSVASNPDGKQFGLYRLHCAHCHGVTGDGKGPTARFLNPYPRDYRPGMFKFKSTFGAARPTRADLKRILMNGIPGTAMPSFRLLPDSELDALIEYVIYLSVRGETERALIDWIVFDGPEPPSDDDDPEDHKEAEETFQAELAAYQAGLRAGLPLVANDDGVPQEPEDDEQIVAQIVYGWHSAKEQKIQPIDVPDDSEKDSINRGRQLFYSKAANCFSCHGDSAQGDGQTTDFDKWFAWRKELDQKSAHVREKKIEEFLAVGALPPRNIRPRNLRLGVYRGGRRPVDIYRRIYSGINGTPMPAFPLAPGGAPADEDEEPAEGAGGAEDQEPDVKIELAPEDVWHLVHYVKSLQYEPLSRPPKKIVSEYNPAR